MRDLKLFYEDGFDIDVDSSFDPVYVDYPNQTQDQRAAVASTIAQGTIPGSLVGTDWGALMNTDENEAIMSLYDSAKQMINDCAANGDNPVEQYLPMVYKDEETGKLVIKTIRGGAQ